MCQKSKGHETLICINSIAKSILICFFFALSVTIANHPWAAHVMLPDHSVVACLSTALCTADRARASLWEDPAHPTLFVLLQVSVMTTPVPVGMSER